MKSVCFLLSATLMAPCCVPVAVAQAPTVATDKTQRERDATAAALVRLINDAIAPKFVELSEGAFGSETPRWNAYYQPSSSLYLFDLIFVERDEAVEMQDAFVGPNGPMLTTPIPTHKSRPNFKLSVAPYLSPAEYAQFKSKNAEIDRQLVELDAQMKDIKREHKSDRYLPDSEAQKRRVNAYEKLKATRKTNLPDFYFRDISLSWSQGWGYRPMWGTDPEYILETEDKEGWELEQARVAQSVVKLLTRYEATAK